MSELTPIQQKIALSAQPCGCDPGAAWICRAHQAIGFKIVEPDKCRFAFLCGEEPFIAIPNPTAPVLSEATRSKQYPIATGFLDYFPDAIAEIAHISFIGNQQHHPDKPLHWDRTKSTDEADACMRHFKDRGTRDSDGQRHSAKAAWRILALLQKEIEAEQK